MMRTAEGKGVPGERKDFGTMPEADVVASKLNLIFNLPLLRRSRAVVRKLNSLGGVGRI